eukprot:1110399-Prymnesium_polylepis.3
MCDRDRDRSEHRTEREKVRDGVALASRSRSRSCASTLHLNVTLSAARTRRVVVSRPCKAVALILRSSVPVFRFSRHCAQGVSQCWLLLTIRTSHLTLHARAKTKCTETLLLVSQLRCAPHALQPERARNGWWHPFRRARQCHWL